jgi:hypothetical protein
MSQLTKCFFVRSNYEILNLCNLIVRRYLDFVMALNYFVSFRATLLIPRKPRDAAPSLLGSFDPLEREVKLCAG